MNILKDKKIVITGGAGFIGSNLCEFFLSNDNKVICLDNLSTGKRSNIQHLENNSNFQFVLGVLEMKLSVIKCVKMQILFFMKLLLVRCHVQSKTQ